MFCKRYLSSRAWWTLTPAGCGCWPGWPPSSGRSSEPCPSRSYLMWACSSRPGRPASPHHNHTSYHLPTSLWERKKKRWSLLSSGVCQDGNCCVLLRWANALTSGEGVQGGVGPLLTHIRKSNRTVTILPTTGRLSSNHNAVLLFSVVGLVWFQSGEERTFRTLPMLRCPCSRHLTPKYFWWSAENTSVVTVDDREESAGINILHRYFKKRHTSYFYSLTWFPVEIFQWRGVGPLPASVDVQVIEADPQSSTVAGQ